MSNLISEKIFRFSAFNVSHGNSSMPIGTDSILLGCWSPLGPGKKILDIGTGCGVISLILANRIKKEFTIEAIDIDKNSIDECNYNFSNSPWPQHLNVFHKSLQEWEGNGYDLIVCNPPFFNTGPHSPKKVRAQARHQVSLTIESLLFNCAKKLNKDGKLCLILPFLEKETLFSLANKMEWGIEKCTWFRSYETKPYKRILVSLVKNTATTISPLEKQNSITQYNKNGSWHEEYLALAGFIHHPDSLNKNSLKEQF